MHSGRGRAWAWRGEEPRPLSQRLGNHKEPSTWAISQGQIPRPPLLWMTLSFQEDCSGACGLSLSWDLSDIFLTIRPGVWVSGGRGRSIR